MATGAPVVADQLEGIRGNGDVKLFAQPRPTEAARVVFRRDLLVEGGGIDPKAGPAWVLDFLMRNQATAVETLEVVGVRRRFPDRRRALAPRPGNARHAVLNRRLIDWSELATRGVSRASRRW